MSRLLQIAFLSLTFSVAAIVAIPPSAEAVPGDQSFLTLADGFSQDLVGVDPGFMGGVAFAADGDPLVSPCVFSGGNIRRFDLDAAPIATNGSELAPVSTRASQTGCGMATHPNGSLYSNTSNGAIRIDPETGAVLTGAAGPSGNALGITVNPQTLEIAYVGSGGTIHIANEDLTSFRTLSSSLNGKFLDGIFFSPSGNFLFAANRTDRSASVIDVTDGSLVQSIPLGREPDGIAFHGTDQFVLTVNLDGTLSRIDFENDDFRLGGTVSTFATGGFRGDLSEVGPDGCLYLTQAGTRYADGTTSSANSLVRICGDFSPPAGSYQDRDGDALLDTWEENGVDIDGDGVIDIDLPAMGADPDRRDIFIEIDWMIADGATPCILFFFCPGPDFEDHDPDPDALRLIVDAFAEAPQPAGPIAVHIDAGPDSLMNNGQRWGVLSGGNSLFMDEVLGSADSDGNYDWSEFQAIKDSNFDAARRDIFHYVVYAHYGPARGSSTEPRTGLLGESRGIPGSDLVVYDEVVANRPQVEAVNLMHELGHNLNLRHGGGEGSPPFNYKPNYLSIMNYSFSMWGIPSSRGRLIDYSRQELAGLDETSLSEPDGLQVVGGGTVPSHLRTSYFCPGARRLGNPVPANQSINWDCFGDNTGTGIRADINGRVADQTLDGYDDWANIRFNGGLIGANEAIETNPLFTSVDSDYDADEFRVVNPRNFDLVARPAPEHVYLQSGTEDAPLALQLRSEGTVDDLVEVAVSGDLSVVSIVEPVPQVAVPAGRTVPIELLVSAPPGVSGSFNVEVEVTSVNDPIARVSFRFTVHVTEPMVDELLERLEIETADRRPPALANKTAELRRNLDGDDIEAACSTLEGLGALTRAQRGKHIEAKDADEILALVSEVSSLLGC